MLLPKCLTTIPLPPKKGSRAEANAARNDNRPEMVFDIVSSAWRHAAASNVAGTNVAVGSEDNGKQSRLQAYRSPRNNGKIRVSCVEPTMQRAPSISNNRMIMCLYAGNPLELNYSHNMVMNKVEIGQSAGRLRTNGSGYPQRPSEESEYTPSGVETAHTLTRKAG